MLLRCLYARWQKGLSSPFSSLQMITVSIPGFVIYHTLCCLPACAPASFLYNTEIKIRLECTKQVLSTQHTEAPAYFSLCVLGITQLFGYVGLSVIPINLKDFQYFPNNVAIFYFPPLEIQIVLNIILLEIVVCWQDFIRIVSVSSSANYVIWVHFSLISLSHYVSYSLGTSHA